MSTTKSTKLKINDVAKELNTTGQELADFVNEKLGVTKKPTASLTEDEMNYVLEAFSQNNQVENFDAYFATKNQPVEEPKNKLEVTHDTAEELSIDENGEVSLSDDFVIGRTTEIFGPKIYDDIGTMLIDTVQKIELQIYEID